MAINKVIYNQQILIDLTNDTVTEETLVNGFTAHKSDGTVIIGKLFEGYPEEVCLYELIKDSIDDAISDSSGDVINGRIVYRKA